MGMLALVFLVAVELFFLVWAIRTRDYHNEERGIVRIGILALFGLLLGAGVYVLSFRYLLLLPLLGIQALVGTIVLFRRKETPYGTRRTILRFVRNSLIILLALAPAVLFPQYEQSEPTGPLAVATNRYTWTDSSRRDPYSLTDEFRVLSVEFWYPEANDQKYPLILFSHGAFGFSGSNYSTCMELASHGYVVASIGHTHQAFFTLDTNGKLTTADPDFIAKATRINADEDPNHAQESYATTREWMKLRTEDENFILDTILAECVKHESHYPFSQINTEKIGLMGHSLGGASSAQVGRERDDIDAVIVLDGTMLGEEIACVGNTVVLNDKPYPIALLNIYAQDHYTNAKSLLGDSYSNFHASHNALVAYETVVKDSGHLNFTDLPLFSPQLAKMLGVGTVDPWYCIGTMNSIVLQFFNSFLKEAGEPNIAKEY